MIHRKNLKRNQDTKPIFYCPNEKINNTYYPFTPNQIFSCSIPNCFCKNINGWVANCGSCGKIVHSCIHGCNRGIIIDLKEKKHSKIPNSNSLEIHYLHFHQDQPVFLHTDLDLT